jgi:hypothetical protein
MKRIKDRFNDDPYFATYLMIAGAVVATGLLRAVAKTVESSAYAYRASKM